MSYSMEEVLEVYGEGYSSREDGASIWVVLEEEFGIDEIDSELSAKASGDSEHATIP